VDTGTIGGEDGAMPRRASAPPPPEDPTASTTTTDADPPEPGLTLEELAEASGVSPRTIRYYQAEKLLPKPRRDPDDARVARYQPSHVERLRLIGELRDRGLKLPAVRALLAEGGANVSIGDWLGLDERLRGPWATDLPRIADRHEVAATLAGTPPGTQAQLEDAGLLTRQGGAWLLPNPALLDLTVGLIRDGVPADAVLEAGAILQRHLRPAADALIDLFVDTLRDGFGQGSDPAALVDALRPVAGDAARMIFGQQLQRAIDALLADTKRLGRR